jgi:hypothetical protein
MSVIRRITWRNTLHYAQQVVSFWGRVGVPARAQINTTRRDRIAHKGVVSRSVARRRSIVATFGTSRLASSPAGMWLFNSSPALLLLAGLFVVTPSQASRNIIINVIIRIIIILWTNTLGCLTALTPMRIYIVGCLDKLRAPNSKNLKRSVHGFTLVLLRGFLKCLRQQQKSPSGLPVFRTKFEPSTYPIQV